MIVAESFFMPLKRYALIVPKKQKKKILQKLKGYESCKLVAEKANKILFVYEGRQEIDTDLANSCSVAIDDEDNYLCFGDIAFGSDFSARVEVSVGYCIAKSDKDTLEKNKKTASLLKEIGGDISTEDGYCFCQLFVCIGGKYIPR